MGFIVMTGGALLCGISHNVLQLIVFRFLQGVGAAMTQSVGRALAMEAIPKGSEGKAQGFMTMAFHSGFFVGPPLGGFIVEYISWRWIFFFLVPLGLVGVALSTIGSKGSSGLGTGGRRPSVDYQGAALLIALTVMLTLLLDRKAGNMVGITHRGLLTLVFAGTIWRFLAHENKTQSPLLDLSLFKIRMFACSVVSLLSLSITRGLVGFLLPFYIQGILNISPSFMGLMYLASPIFTVTLAPVSGHITDRIGPKVPATIGVLVAIAMLLIGIYLRTDSHWFVPTLMLALTGIATAFFNAANLAALIGSVPKENRGFATGMVHTAFDLGHMLGVSVGGLFLTLSFQYYSGIPGATPNPEYPIALVYSMNASYLLATAIGLVALLTSAMRGSGKIRAAEEEAH